MIWVYSWVELVMIAFVLISLWNEKEKKRGVTKSKLGITQIIGMQITAFLPSLKQKRKKAQMYKIICTLEGEENGEEVYEVYQQKRKGLIFGVIFLINTICICQTLLSHNVETTLENPQERPEYGQGDRSQNVTVILEGEETAETVISLRIPEKEISAEEAKQRVEEGMAYIKNRLNGLKIKKDIILPAEWEEVSFFYESLSPELLSSTGRWLGDIEDTVKEIKMKVTAVVSGESKTEELTFFTVSWDDLGAVEKLALMLKRVEEGKFLTEDELVLPEETTEGEKLIWIETEESNEMIWLVLGMILLLFVLWQQDQEYKKMLKEREQKTRQSYPEFMNELVILVGAGMSLSVAWRRIGQDYQKKKEEGGELNPLYEEIYRGSREMEAGASMREVLEAFAGNMRFKEARRFAVLLAQNLKRGDAFLVNRLKELNQEAWDLRKKHVREKTEEADTKLLLPLMLMLAVILIIVLSPAMITMQV